MPQALNDETSRKMEDASLWPYNIATIYRRGIRRRAIIITFDFMTLLRRRGGRASPRFNLPPYHPASRPIVIEERDSSKRRRVVMDYNID